VSNIIRPSAVTLSDHVSHWDRMQISANNLANQGTTGFRSMLQSRKEVSARIGNQDAVSFAKSSPVYLDLKPGGFEEINSPLALALAGKGFMSVNTPEGVKYVRSAQFFKSDTGVVIDHNGNTLLGTNGEIKIDAGTNNIEISNSGIVSTENGIVGKIKVVTFENPHHLRHAGNGLYRTEQEEINVKDTKILQGKLESSNVTAIIEITESMRALRQFEATQRLMDMDEQNQQSMISASAKNV
jgi:flagellar basal-body rod protein FlgF